MFARLDLAEKAGTGVSRIKIALEEAGLPASVFEVAGPFVRIRISRPTSQKTSQKVLNLIQENSSITVREIAEALKISERAAKYHVEAHKAAGRLKRIGPDKGGHWHVV